MTAPNLQPLYDAMATHDSITIRKAIAGIVSNLEELEPRQIPEVVEVIASLFYIDLGDIPEYVPVVHEAVSAIVAIGEPAVPTLMWLLGESDRKANLLQARVLGRIGPPAYGPLKDLFYRAENPWQRAMALFAMAKMHEGALMEIFPDVITSLDDSDRELRDTAARTLGRIIDAFQPGQLPQDTVTTAFEKLLFHLQDFSGVVRAKSVRTIGKMARSRYLDDAQLQIATEAIESLLGLDEGESDPFYVVRREAQEALDHLQAASEG